MQAAWRRDMGDFRAWWDMSRDYGELFLFVFGRPSPWKRQLWRSRHARRRHERTERKAKALYDRATLYIDGVSFGEVTVRHEWT